MATQDKRNSYKIKVSVSIRTSLADSWNYSDIAETDRCSTAKFDCHELELRTHKVLAAAELEIKELIQMHVDEIDEKEALLRAKEEAGESC